MILVLLLSTLSFLGVEGCYFRRALEHQYDNLVAQLPEACTNPEYSCEEHTDLEFEIDVITADVANDVTSFYCCAIRKDDIDDLLVLAGQFHTFCKQNELLALQDEDQLSVAQLALLHYCDDLVTNEQFSFSQRMQLGTLIAFEDNAQLHSCSDPAGNEEVTVHLSGFNFEDGMTHAAIQLGDDEFYSWGPDVLHYGLESAQHLVEEGLGVSLMDGVKGNLYETSTIDMDYEVSLTISGVKKELIRNRIEEFKSHKPLYSFIKYNCAHFVLQVLAEGLGCESEVFAFLSPVALKDILTEQVQTGEIYDRRRNLATVLSKTAQRVSRLMNIGN